MAASARLHLNSHAFLRRAPGLPPGLLGVASVPGQAAPGGGLAWEPREWAKRGEQEAAEAGAQAEALASPDPAAARISNAVVALSPLPGTRSALPAEPPSPAAAVRAVASERDVWALLRLPYQRAA